MTNDNSNNNMFPQPNAILMFENGTEFQGYGIGLEGIVCGELCFNTAMTGYQEILTDPSYFGQIITFTSPHIGNVGSNAEDFESKHIKAQGLVVRELPTESSNWRAENGFNEWLLENEITGIAGIDTREITTYIRQHGHPRVAIAFHEGGLRELDRGAIIDALTNSPNMNGAELTQYVRSSEPYEWNESLWDLEQGYSTGAADGFHVVAIDYGAKLNILRHLAARGFRVSVISGAASLAEIMALNPDGVFLSNGPGDPAATALSSTPVIQGLLAKNIPIFGICLGHQLLALAMGAKTEKLYQGHRGANHPVKNLQTGKVEITSQNHGFVVQSDVVPNEVEVTHVSLFDGTIEGIKHRTKPAFSVQYHPESSPGPHDSLYLFDEFMQFMAKNKG
jgi:carbamoyl-phosphate synthase small subunit